MHVRLLAPDDQAQLEAFLTAHWTAAMLLRSNLRQVPLGATGDYGGPWAGAFDGGGLVAVASYTELTCNILLLGDVAAAAACAAMVAADRVVNGLLGPWACVTAAEQALGFGARRRLSGAPEVLYALELAQLSMPGLITEGIVQCRRAAAADRDLLAGWRADYWVETLGAARGPETQAGAAREIERYLAAERPMFVVTVDEPVAMCTFNAALPDVVQLGGVWTPRPLRGRGYARSVVAGALDSVRHEGVSRAVLFTEETNTSAQRAYEAVGFQPVGDYGMVIYALA
jgi:RimJ/RimL family protein N-acetyltransferase